MSDSFTPERDNEPRSVAANTPPIATAIGRLDTTAQEIAEIVEQLAKKLEPVLNPNDKSCSVDENKKAVSCSPLVTRLSQVDHVGQQSKRTLLDLLNNLEI